MCTCPYFRSESEFDILPLDDALSGIESSILDILLMNLCEFEDLDVTEKKRKHKEPV